MKKIRIEDLANNPPRHPGLQDLDIWTKEQLIDTQIAITLQDFLN
jgi:hypothetical protein